MSASQPGKQGCIRWDSLEARAGIGHDVCGECNSEKTCKQVPVLNIYLAASGLSYGTRDLSLWVQGFSLVAARRLWSAGSEVAICRLSCP